MDDRKQTAQKDAEAEREKGAALEYDAQDEEALEEAPSAAAAEGETRA